MKSLLRLSALLLPTILLVACSAPTNISQAPPTKADSLNEFHLGIGDSIEVNVWENPELSTRTTVRPDGKISLPLIGDIVAAGRTPDQLDESLTEAIGRFIKNPVVSVMVLSFDSAQYQRRVRITGAVAQPTSIAWREGMTVLDLLLIAGGATEFAAPNKSYLYRKDANGVVKAYPIRLNDILRTGDLSTNYELAPSDIVTVTERSF